MLHRLRRPAALVLPLFLAATLTACGDEEAPTNSAEGFDAVEVSGEFGQVPEVDWKAMLDATESHAEVLVEGDGAVIEEDDKVLVNWAVSDEYTESIGSETYGEEAPASTIDLATEPTSPPPAPVDLLMNLVRDQIEPGTTTVGTRIAVTADADEEWGDDPSLANYVLGLVEYGLGNEDGFVLVADLEAVPLAAPQGAPKPAPAWAPRVVKDKDGPTALDTDGLPKPDPKAKTLAKAVVIEGTGPVVEKGDTIVVDYLGQVWGGAKPFDESFTKQPLEVPIGAGAVVKGWDQGLVGVPVGSRVILRIPPTLGYGKKGSGDIKGTDTMYFVVDVLAAA